MDTLQGQLKKFRETVDAFPVGAATCNGYSLENEIARITDTITLASARLLMLKTRDKQRKYAFCDVRVTAQLSRVARSVTSSSSLIIKLKIDILHLFEYVKLTESSRCVM
jgi:hypothetical protein